MGPGTNGTGMYDQEDMDFLYDVAKSFGEESLNVLAIKLGYSDAQALADHYGYRDILAFFSAPGNAARLLDLKIRLVEQR